MENMDPHTQRQVWERVSARPVEPQGDGFRAMLMTALELTAVYRYLMGVLTGRAKEQVRQLYAGESANVAALKGIGLLSGRREEVLKVWNPTKAPAGKQLETCYHRTRRCMVEYAARSAEAEFGVVFQKMAQREGEHCTVLAELLGSQF